MRNVFKKDLLKILFILAIGGYLIAWLLKTPEQLNVSLVKDKIQIGLTATSILLPACIVILLFLLDQEKYKKFPNFIKNFENIFGNFIGALWWWGTSLLFGVWNFLRFPMTIKSNFITEPSEIIYTGLFGAIQFWALFFGIIRILKGSYQIKKSIN